MTMNLLVELLVEELPPKALKMLGEAFGHGLFKDLELNNFLDSGASLTTYATPRRLAAHISNVRITSPDKELRTTLMPSKIGLDSAGELTPALKKKLINNLGYHAEVDFEAIKKNLTTENDGKNENLIHTVMASGSTLRFHLEFALEEVLDSLPIPKVMTYQLADGWTSAKFVRPAHGLVVMHGNDPIIDIQVLGLKSGNLTQGHRFEATSANFKINNADSYESQMESEGAVIPSFEKRRTEIARQLNDAAAKQDLKPIEDAALLDEVTGLVEYPNVLVGKFEKEYLEVPQECLILTMKANQKYFPLLDSKGKLTNKFLIVSNIHPADPSLVVGGNERVVRPRLADAKFFFDQDRKKTLESRVLGLAKVVYHNKLGTQGERVQRVCAIAKTIGQQLGGDNLAMQAEQAALLAKADLLTDMVGEFPELQGIMGRYYAKHDGLSDDIAFAIEDHYKPRFAGDELPRNMVGICVALADKLETLAGMFGIGQIPTGDKDPFALRRHALGVLRMLIEKELPLSLFDLINIAFAGFPKGLLSSAHTDLEIFMFERLEGLLREQGYSTNEVEAVLCMNPTQIYLVPKQLEAVRAFAALPEAAALAAANKRVVNILKQAEAKGESFANSDEAKLQETTERALFHALKDISPKADLLYGKGDYAGYLKVFAALKLPVDAFFDHVMVMVDDADLRSNRLALLYDLRKAMNKIADLSRLAS